MTNYLPESRSFGVGSIHYAPTSTTAESHRSRERLLVDSIEYGQQQDAQTQKDILASATVGIRASLPPPKDPSSPDELALLTEAFCAAFSAIDKGMVTQTQDYVQLQQLNQTQTQAVLQSTTNAINAQQQAENLAEQISDYQAHMAKAESIFGWVMFGVGIALMAATIASGFFDFGASDAALPAEMEMLGDVEMDTFADSSGELEEISPNESVETSETETEPENATSESESNTASQRTTQEQTEQTTENTQNKANRENSKSARKWSLRIGKVLLKMTIAAGFGSPMLMTGIVDLKVSKQLNQLDQDQISVGTSMETLELNKMYFQFLQQLCQREGGAMQEESSDASEVIDTYSSITSTWRQVSYGLANAA
jgi:hypothetical protein